MFRTPAATFKTFIFVSLGILIFGDIMVFSAAQVTGLTIGGNSFTISGKQIVLSVISVLCAWVIAQIPIVNVKKIARVALFLALGIMLLLIPFGVDVNGNKNWVSFGPLDFQPSEVAKLLLRERHSLEILVENPVNYISFSKNDKSKLSYLTPERFATVDGDFWGSSKRFIVKPGGLIKKIFKAINLRFW